MLEINNISQSIEEAFQKVVIVIDRDEVETEEIFIDKLKSCLDSQQVQAIDNLKNDEWVRCHYRNFSS